MKNFMVKPTAYVQSKIKQPTEMPHGGVNAVVNVLPEYALALERIEENSHLWLLCWFHQADRQVLTAKAGQFGTDQPEYGVFAIRTMQRPNPIALTRVRLLKRDGLSLRVEGLDAIDGTPVLDIKPYFQSDIVFSPRTSYIFAQDRGVRLATMRRRALNHHREECAGLWLALRMALIAEEELGHLHDDAVTVSVTGSACLADTVQVLATARVANPPRFNWHPDEKSNQTIWNRDRSRIILTARREFTPQQLQEFTDEQLLWILRENG